MKNIVSVNITVYVCICVTLLCLGCQSSGGKKQDTDGQDTTDSSTSSGSGLEATATDSHSATQIALDTATQSAATDSDSHSATDSNTATDSEPIVSDTVTESDSGSGGDSGMDTGTDTHTDNDTGGDTAEDTGTWTDDLSTDVPVDSESDSETDSGTGQTDTNPVSELTVTGTTPTTNPTPTWTWSLPYWATDFRYRFTNGDDWTVVGGTHVTSFTPTEPLADGYYEFEVQAADDTNQWSLSASFVTLVDTTAPAAPALYGESPTTNLRPTWGWTTRSETTMIRFRLDGGEWIEVTEPYDVTSYTPDFDLAVGSHIGEIQALDYSGLWSVSEFHTIVIALEPPGTPEMTNVVHWSGDDFLTLSWTDGDGDETGWIVERKTGDGEFVEIFNGPVDQFDGRDYVPVHELVSYAYRVKAFNEYGESAFSNEFLYELGVRAPIVEVDGGWDGDAFGCHISWSDQSDIEVAYEIERRIGNDGDYEPFVTLPADAEYYLDDTVPEYTWIYYRIRAVDDLGNASDYDDGGVLVYLRHPLDFRFAGRDAEGRTLLWEDESEIETSYVLWRSPSEQGTYEQIAELPANTTEYVDTYNPSGNYYYRLQAVKLLDGYDDVYRRSRIVETNTTGVIVGRVDSFRVDLETADTIILRWSMDTEDPYDGFILERKDSANGTYTELATLPVDARSYADPELTEGTKYYYRISTFVGEFHSSYLEDVGETILPGPSGLTATALSSTEVLLTWDNNASGDGDVVFHVERRELPNGSTWDYAGLATTTSLLDDSQYLVPGTGYSYRVMASNGQVHSAYAVTTCELPPLPAAPENPSVYVQNESAPGLTIELEWDYPGTDIDGFQITRYIQNTQDAQYTVDATQRSYLDVDVVAGTTYKYRIRAYNSNGYSNALGMEVTAIPENAVQITHGMSWYNGELISNGEIHWYYMYMLASDDFDLYWDDASEGSGDMTADIKVSVYHMSISNTPFFTARDSGFVNPSAITASIDEIVYIKVEGVSTIVQGTYSLLVDPQP
ncbi:MAG: fibronectin type III domain-containing protein [Deltaproteobacteria bacterium]|nr:fibronectin type III domain-containing protein [Deltaproteobacteria bacterium]